MRWLGVALALAALAAGCGPRGPQDARVAAPVADLGEMGQQERAEHVFEVANAGGRPLRLVAVEDTCPCTNSEILDARVPPGGVGRVRTVFSTLWFRGEVTKDVVLTTDDPDTPKLTLTLRARVTEDLGLEPRVHYLGTVRGGGRRVVRTVLRNRTGREVRVGLAGPPGEGVAVEGALPLVLGPGESRPLEVAVTPPEGAGAFFRTVELEAEGARPGRFKIVLSGRYGR